MHIGSRAIRRTFSSTSRMPSMPSPLSVVPQHPLGAIPATPSGRFDAIPLPQKYDPPPEDKLARVIGAGLAVFLSGAAVALTYLTLSLR